MASGVTADTNADRSEKLSLHASWAMAVGGMVGGGIFAVLGLIVGIAGWWAWLSFIIGGLLALATGYSYTRLASRYSGQGAEFGFICNVHNPTFAGSLAWLLIISYLLTLSVYAFTFGFYAGRALGWSSTGIRLLAIAGIAGVVVVNLLGVVESAWLEIVTVWAKLLVLAGLAAIGLATWNSENFAGGSQPGPLGILGGAAAVFMAYQGFEMLTYDYRAIARPQVTLRRAIPAAILAVMAVYVLVTLAALSLVGPQVLASRPETALVWAGEAAMGRAGAVLITIAAVLSASAAMNATVFATGRLMKRAADRGELPHAAGRQSKAQVPCRAILLVGIGGAILAALGTLGELVQGTSLMFLGVFGIVNWIAFRRLDGPRWISLLGAFGAAAAAVTLLMSLVSVNPVALWTLSLLVVVVVGVRPIILRRATTRHVADDPQSRRTPCDDSNQ